MSSDVLDQLPTLTEVVECSRLHRLVGPSLPGAAWVSPALLTGTQLTAVEQPVTELSADLLFELESRVSLGLESRLREALEPVLARAADALVQDAMKELAAAMRELVEEAVTQAIERHTVL